MHVPYLVYVCMHKLKHAPERLKHWKILMCFLEPMCMHHIKHTSILTLFPFLCGMDFEETYECELFQAPVPIPDKPILTFKEFSLRILWCDLRLFGRCLWDNVHGKNAHGNEVNLVGCTSSNLQKLIFRREVI